MMGFDASKWDDASFLALHEALAARNAPKPGSFSTLEGDERRAYFREAKRLSRSRESDRRKAGDVAPTTANVRTALADAALMILAVDAPGADQVRAVLALVFRSRPGAPLSIETKAKRGRLRPRLAGKAAQ